MLDALITDEGEMAAHLAFNESVHLMLAFAAKGAVKGLVARKVLLVGHESEGWGLPAKNATAHDSNGVLAAGAGRASLRAGPIARKYQK